MNVDFNSAESVQDWMLRLRNAGLKLVLVIVDRNSENIRGHSVLVECADIIVDARNNPIKLIKDHGEAA